MEKEPGDKAVRGPWPHSLFPFLPAISGEFLKFLIPVLLEESAAPGEIHYVKQCETLPGNRWSQPPGIAKIFNHLRRPEQRRSIVRPKKPLSQFVDAAFHRQIYFLSILRKKNHELLCFQKYFG